MSALGTEAPSTHGANHWTHRMPNRVPRGEDRLSAKLTTAQVRALRATVEAAPRGLKKRVLSIAARELGICCGHARDIVVRRKWRHVP